MSAQKDYLLSIVVPTRNRQFYAVQSIKQILDVTDERVQVVVSDNSEDNSLQEMVKELDEQRVKYEYIADRIPGVDNYANGISMCDGEYVCCIGDDDGVLREIIDLVQWASENKVSAIKPGVQAAYIWPNTVDLYKTGCLSLGVIDASYKIVDPKEELKDFLKTGCIDFPNAKLVKAYHGIVKRDLFEEIKNRTGRYCGGLSPDIYLSVSLSLLTDQVVCINIPMTIFGACKQSTTGDSLNRTNVGKLEDAPHFVGQAYEWSDRVPRYYCGTNIWADSALHALSDMGEEMISLFSVEHLTCACLQEYKEYTKEIMENFYRNGGDEKKLADLMQKESGAHNRREIKNSLKRHKALFNAYKRIRDFYFQITNSQSFSRNGVPDIAEAEKIVSAKIHAAFEQLLMEGIKEVR